MAKYKIYSKDKVDEKLSEIGTEVGTEIDLVRDDVSAVKSSVSSLDTRVSKLEKQPFTYMPTPLKYDDDDDPQTIGLPDADTTGDKSTYKPVVVNLYRYTIHLDVSEAIVICLAKTNTAEINMDFILSHFVSGVVRLDGTAIYIFDNVLQSISTDLSTASVIDYSITNLCED